MNKEVLSLDLKIDRESLIRTVCSSEFVYHASPGTIVIFVVIVVVVNLGSLTERSC